MNNETNVDCEWMLIRALKLLLRYRYETPLGHQPHMIAGEAEEVIAYLRRFADSSIEKPIIWDGTGLRAALEGTCAGQGFDSPAPATDNKDDVPDSISVGGYSFPISDIEKPYYRSEIRDNKREGKRVDSSPPDCKSGSFESAGASPALPTTTESSDVVIGKLLDIAAFRRAFDNMPECIKTNPHYAWFCELYETAKEPKPVSGDNWQPIETAPRDGADFLAIGNGCSVVYFDKHASSKDHPWAGDSDRNYHQDSFTHWMHLPKPPKEGNQND